MTGLGGVILVFYLSDTITVTVLRGSKLGREDSRAAENKVGGGRRTEPPTVSSVRLICEVAARYSIGHVTGIQNRP